MKEKEQKLVGMVLFSALVILLLWHVNYEDMDLVGMRTNPSGYNSIAYQLLSQFIDDSYPYTALLSTWWALTQVIPVLVSWGIRNPLGKCVKYFELAVKKLYSLV